MYSSELDKLLAIIKVWNEYETLNNEQYGHIVKGKINILLELTNSLFVEQVKMMPWQMWSEPLVFKFCYHLTSLIDLFYGTEIPYEKEHNPIIIFDEPSMFILFRSVLENYLTLFYLYFDNSPDKEKEFRMLIWRYAGVKQRTEFEINTEDAKQRQESELQALADIKNEIIQSELFTSFDKKSQKTLLDGKKPRMFETWKSLMKKSGLDNGVFKNLYGYKSNYSHTEFISVMQLKEGQYGHHKNNIRSHHSMLLVHGLIGKTIIELKNYFPTIGVLFDSKDTEIKNEIYYLNEFCTTKEKLQVS